MKLQFKFLFFLFHIIVIVEVEEFGGYGLLSSRIAES